jgi:hypothetical protein
MKQPVFEWVLRATLLTGIRKPAETCRLVEKERR